MQPLIQVIALFFTANLIAFTDYFLDSLESIWNFATKLNDADFFDYI